MKVQGAIVRRKSTLTTVLAARDLTVVGDDAVFLSPERETAIGPGIAPRLRLPPPDGLSEQTEEIIVRLASLTGARYGYLGLPVEGLMDNGADVPIGAFIFLNRTESGPSELVELPKSDVLRGLIWQNFARQAPAQHILDSPAAMVMPRPAYELRYAMPKWPPTS